MHTVSFLPLNEINSNVKYNFSKRQKFDAKSQLEDKTDQYEFYNMALICLDM